MRKKLLSLLVIAGLAISLVACGESEKQTSTKEYSIDEIGSLVKKAEENFEKETKYYTSDEKYGDKGKEIFASCLKEAGVPTDTQITIRGLKRDGMFGMDIISSDSETYINCNIRNVNNIKDFTDNYSLLIENGETIVVSGKFDTSQDSTTSPSVFTDIQILSPGIDYVYANNVADVITSCESTEYFSPNKTIVRGEIQNIFSAAEFMDMCKMSNITTDTLYLEPTDEKKIAMLASDTNNDTKIYFAFYPDMTLEIGDKIAVCGDGVYDLLYDFEKYDGYKPTLGMINFVTSCYVYE